MTTIQLKIPDEIARLMNSFSRPKEEFVLEAIEEKIIREKGKVKLAERGIKYGSLFERIFGRSGSVDAKICLCDVCRRLGQSRNGCL